MSPRFVQYARLTGAASAGAALVRDAKRWPGGKMTGFISWVGRRWEEWRKANGRTADSFLLPADHDAFDAWLASLPFVAKAKRDEWSCPCCGVLNDSAFCAACVKAECGERSFDDPTVETCLAEVRS